MRPKTRKKVKKETKKKGVGRPKIPIDIKKVAKLCAMFSTEVEIANFFNVSIDTLVRRLKLEKGVNFEQYYREHSAKGKESLRRIQWRQAKKYPAMAMFLGKNILGQSDKVESEVTHNNEKFIVIEHEIIGGKE